MKKRIRIIGVVLSASVPLPISSFCVTGVLPLLRVKAVLVASFSVDTVIVVASVTL